MPDDPAPKDQSRPLVVRAAFGAAVGVACGDGAVAALGAPEGTSTAALAFVGTAAVVVAATIVPALLLGALADRPRARALSEGVSRALAGAGRAEIALLMAAAVAAGSIVAGAAVGTALAAKVTAPFAALGAAGSTLAAAAIGLLFTAELGGVSSKVETAPPKHARTGELRLAAALVGVAVLSGAGISRSISLELGLPPAGAIAGAGLGLVVGASAKRRLFGAGLILAGAGAALAIYLDAFPAQARHAILYRSTVAAQLLHVAHAAFDGDGDGYASVLGGADCDDTDPAIHPGAEDVPENGVDEDCSGADAPLYRPAPGLRYVLPEGAARRSMVIVLIDALRPDHLGFAGYERPTTPALDAFRERATWFENAYTPAPSTRFALSSLFTGYDVRRLPHRSLGGNRFELLAGARTLAERLRANGYRTAGHTISYVMHHNLGLGQGFERWGTPWPVDGWRDIYGKAAELTTSAAIETLSGFPEEDGPPYLLFAHYRCTHDPYVAHPEWDYGDRPIDAYDSALSYCDRHIGELLDTVEARADAERTAIFVVSDHGELFGEHGRTRHGTSLYEPDVRVLLLAKIPGARERVVEAPVSLADVAPTALGLAGIEAPGGAEGESLVPLAMGESRPSSRKLFFFTELHKGPVVYRAIAALDWPHKLIRDLRTGAEELYDVRRDPGERAELLGRGEVRRGAELRAELEGFEAFLSASPAGR